MLGCISHAMLWNPRRCDWCRLTRCVTKQHIRSQTWKKEKKTNFFFFPSKPKLTKQHIFLKRWTSFKRRGIFLNVDPTEKFSTLSRNYLPSTLLVLSRVQSKLEAMMSRGHLSTAAVAAPHSGRFRSLSEERLQQVPEVIALPGEICAF